MVFLLVAVVDVIRLSNRVSNDTSIMRGDDSTIAQLRTQNDQLKRQAAYPTLTIWSKPETVNSASWLVEGVPDTFDFDVSFTSTTPVTVYFLTYAQLVQFANAGSISGVSGQYDFFAATTSIQNRAFSLAEGCAAYVAIFQLAGAGTISPDVTATYNPSAIATGVCAA